MAQWSYNPETLSTGDDFGIVRRHDIDAAALLLHDGGVRNRKLIVDVLTLLSSLSRGEVSFNVEQALAPSGITSGVPAKQLFPQDKQASA